MNAAMGLRKVPLIVQPLRPTGTGWVQWPWFQPAGYAQPYAIERWYNRWSVKSVRALHASRRCARWTVITCGEDRA